jgi:uncharacterized protein
MLVAVERFDLRIRDARSLKQKRHVVSPLTAALRATFGAAAAEVDHHDLWQRAAIAVAVVGREEYHLRKVLHEAEKLVERWAGVEVLATELSIVDPDD